ncbi:Mitochondrial inner membrane i-AAA protease supercomplex subunit YME1 [Pseudocercospora fuligena]|uniref:Mitochondrial inner membrane i-AAA protease supercomplex subunit YME1 n=1 Tax=Pseudocercospora fuligena TaxID=685502 RepID=A0A8H6VQ37_9PEZI|nr:Mitochondrial inner membrane i-AAA protease supercomplex subunit YME1 [Pseudocercospora fuligena]
MEEPCRRRRNRNDGDVSEASAPSFGSFIITSALRTFFRLCYRQPKSRRRTAAGQIINMAFQAAPVSLHQVASTASEMLPVMAEAMRIPFRSIGSAAKAEKKAARKAETQAEAKQVPVRQLPRVEMPEFMSTAPLGALRHQMPSASALQGSFSTASMLSTMPRSTLRYASPLTRSFSLLTPAARSFSTTTRLSPFTLRAPPPKTSFVGFSQQRTIFGSSWGSKTNHNLLAHLEQTANNNPGSATAQNAFYQALLRGNMPEIVVERYQTGRYATNPAIDQTYTKALERVGAAEVGGSGLGAMMGRTPGGNSHNLSNEQLQAIGQAASMKATGGNVSISKQGSGSKSEPLYVVVDESTGSTIFKWVKFFFVFGLVAYCALVVFTLLIEATGMLKRVGGGQTAEAKPELQTTRFTDVHGCDEAKEELQELVEFLKAPERFSTLGGKLPKGVLLVGPPGTGKTLLARAVAGEAGVPFFYMSGSEFDEIYVGVGAKRVRDLFTAARAKSPAIVFIDELDAIGGKRQERDAAYAKQTLNQLLTELDGFDQNSSVIIIGATNFPQSLDKALTRPGRFDRNVQVPLPDVRGRIAILKYHMRNMKIDASVDPAILARGCPGFSGAELENVVNQAAVRASKNKQQKITITDLEWAKDKILMGAERKSAVIQEKDKLMTAYHEGGHALVCLLTEGATPLYKATIMPRGHTLGVTSMLPDLDEVSRSKKQLLASIDVSMGGKVAEELIYGPDNVTTGASSDISSATSVAYHMVTQAGMSDLLGNIDLADNYAKLSTKTKQQIEDEVRRIVEEGRQRAVKLLTTNREALDRLAKALVEYETLTREEMELVVKGEKLPDKIKADVSAPIKAPEVDPPTNVMPSPVSGNSGPFGAPPGPAGDADGVRSTDAMMDEDQNWTAKSGLLDVNSDSIKRASICASLTNVLAFHSRPSLLGGSQYTDCMIVQARIKASCSQSACIKNEALSLGAIVVCSDGRD